jgi:lantibiotic leader peptide-processing serine protease
MRRGSARSVALVAGLMLAALVVPSGGGVSSATTEKQYIVLLTGTLTETAFDLLGTKEAALDVVEAAGGEVTLDLTRQIGTLMVSASSPTFLDVLRASSLVEDAAQNLAVKTIPSTEEAIDRGQLTVLSHEDGPGGGAEPSTDPLEALQWNMEMIRTEAAHATQAGWRAVQVGILDTGIDGHLHPDFITDAAGSNVDCANGRDFVGLLNPGVGLPDPCVDNNFHGTHVAGIVAAQANGIGVVGVAPNVTLIPIKVCDIVGFCYANATIAGATYAGDIKLEVTNNSYFMDDDQLLESNEFKCMSNPEQRVLRQGMERAVNYARNQGVTFVAALGNSDSDLAHPPEPYENECDVVPAETEGVVGTMALGPDSEKASDSSFGFGATDVAAPGGNSRNRDELPPVCGNQVLSTVPVATGAYGCFQGTSMASPHAAGVAALIVSEFGVEGTDAGEPDVRMRPQEVENYLQATTIDLIGAGQPTTRGYDECFGNGRVDALKAVHHDTSHESFVTEPCPEVEGA